MEATELETLKYPIGKYQFPENVSIENIQHWIGEIAAFPALLKSELEDVRAEDLQKRYRPGGWTIHQVVHHCADSHINSLVRFKLALTEDNPVIKPYAESLWAELPDTLDLPVDVAVQLLEAVHTKLYVLLSSLTEEQLQRTFIHPEYNRTQTIVFTIGLYAWHGNHHLAHIRLAKQHGY